jgi:hypothetical protein
MNLPKIHKFFLMSLSYDGPLKKDKENYVWICVFYV